MHVWCLRQCLQKSLGKGYCGAKMMFFTAKWHNLITKVLWWRWKLHLVIARDKQFSLRNCPYYSWITDPVWTVTFSSLLIPSLLSVFFPLPPTLLMIHQQFLRTGCKEWGKFLFSYFMAEEHPEEIYLQTFRLVMQMLPRGDKILKTEIFFSYSFLSGCSAHCSATSSSWWAQIISRKSTDLVQQIETLFSLVTFRPSEVICGLLGISSYAENKI